MTPTGVYMLIYLRLVALSSHTHTHTYIYIYIYSAEHDLQFTTLRKYCCLGTVHCCSAQCTRGHRGLSQQYLYLQTSDVKSRDRSCSRYRLETNFPYHGMGLGLEPLRSRIVQDVRGALRFQLNDQITTSSIASPWFRYTFYFVYKSSDISLTLTMSL